MQPVVFCFVSHTPTTYYFINRSLRHLISFTWFTHFFPPNVLCFWRASKDLTDRWESPQDSWLWPWGSTGPDQKKVWQSTACWWFLCGPQAKNRVYIGGGGRQGEGGKGEERGKGDVTKTLLAPGLRYSLSGPLQKTGTHNPGEP